MLPSFSQSSTQHSFSVVIELFLPCLSLSLSLSLSLYIYIYIHIYIYIYMYVCIHWMTELFWSSIGGSSILFFIFPSSYFRIISIPRYVIHFIFYSSLQPYFYFLQIEFNKAKITVLFSSESRRIISKNRLKRTKKILDW